MDIISRVIKEEINRYILSEAVDFTNLQTYANELNNSLGNISTLSNDNTVDKGLRKFLYDFVVYCVQIIAAINRCIKANSLNEALGGLSNYGINLPPELGGNLWNDAVRGYYNTKNFLQNRRGNYNGNSASGYANGRVNQNTVPSVKLSFLLQQLPKWQQAYATKASQYNIMSNVQLTNDFNRILGNNGIIPNIQAEYTLQQQNAQGNP